MFTVTLEIVREWNDVINIVLHKHLECSSKESQKKVDVNYKNIMVNKMWHSILN